ncbi:MAG: alpha/beta hydrolase [Micavibrio aeruginosavorus]|uniref:Alpha/beta hydrolase n=1 Tax=Micavibrio aeruginosavorus TaxID=349221 RepID=A0A7T5R228_9BACT|nr:MAG: alpha/beta hydrolase [Micavibrio aeruginosavorus]
MTSIRISPEWAERLTTPPDNWNLGLFRNGHGHLLRYACAQPKKPARGQVVYVEGLNEPLQKTYELARDFNKRALGFAVFDRLGQGHSGRLLKDRFKIHSHGFHHHVADLIKFSETIMPRDHKVTLLGHSTGGLIALMAYHDRPDLFTEPFLNAPLFGMMQPLIRNREDLLARLRLPPFITESYVPKGQGWRLRGTGGWARQEAYSSHPERMRLHDYFPQKHPYLRAGDPTIGWVQEACRAMMIARNPKWLSEVGPVTIATSGQDHVTDNLQTIKIMPHLKQVLHIIYSGSRHEAPFETDDIRGHLIETTAKLALKG